MRRWVAIVVVGLAACPRPPPPAPEPVKPHVLGYTDFAFPHPLTWGPNTVSVNGQTCLNLDAGGPIQTDPVQGGNTTVKLTCKATALYNSATGIGTNLSLSAQLLGSEDQVPNSDGGVWVPYTGVDAGAVASDGGSAMFGFALGQGQVYSQSALVVTGPGTAVTDGGFLCCNFVAQ